MTNIPAVTRKTEELFLRWASQPDTTHRLQHELALLQAGQWDPVEATARHAQQVITAESQTLHAPVSSMVSPGSPRFSLSSPRRRSSGTTVSPVAAVPAVAPVAAVSPVSPLSRVVKGHAVESVDAAALTLSVAELALSEEQPPPMRASPLVSPRTPPRTPPSTSPLASPAVARLTAPVVPRMAQGAYKTAIPRFHVRGTGSDAAVASGLQAGQVAATTALIQALAVKGRLTVALCERAAEHMGLSRYCGHILAVRCGLDVKKQSCPVASVVALWVSVLSACPDPAARLAAVLSSTSAKWLLPADFFMLVDYVVRVHPGLAFLLDRPEFHERYVHTVVQRLFFEANRSWSGKLSVSELRRSSLIESLTLLDDEPRDINRNRDLFSYEHFYVIYTTFWKLDSDHDLAINRAELARYNSDSLSELVVARIFAHTVLRPCSPPGKMAYDDFVWFILAVEDKAHPTSVEYWFRCMDLDGDGVVSLYEMSLFFEEQAQRLLEAGADVLAFGDVVCLALDMVKPQRSDNITLADLRKCGQAAQFFNIFFDVNKYLDAEEKDPFAAQREKKAEGALPLTEWMRFAAAAYQLLSTEEDDDEAGSSDGGRAASRDDDDDGTDLMDEISYFDVESALASPPHHL